MQRLLKFLLLSWTILFGSCSPSFASDAFATIYGGDSARNLGRSERAAGKDNVSRQRLAESPVQVAGLSLPNRPDTAPSSKSDRSPAKGTPLTETEKREIIVRLAELKALRTEVELLRQYVERDGAMDKRERDNYERSIELEKQGRGLVEKERDLMQKERDFYEQAFKQLTKRGGAGCALIKILTLGLGRCL